MSNLLQIVRTKPTALQKKGNLPLLLEIRVPVETSPYLVSSSTSYLWVEEAFSNEPFVKAAIRESTPGNLFRQAVLEIQKRGVEDQWGNVHPFTETGLLSSIAHVEEFGMGEVEVLIPFAKDEKRPAWLNADTLGYPLRTATWLPAGCAVALPVDREFVGVIVHLSARHVAAVIHNAARSVGIAVGG